MLIGGKGIKKTAILCLFLAYLVAGFFVSAQSESFTPSPAINYAPNLWFSQGEKYYPTNPLDFYFKNGEEVNGEIAVKKYNQLSVQEKLNNLTVLYHIEDEGNEWVYQYWFFYAFNDFKRLTKNKHYGDWESVFVFVNKESGKINKAIGTAHQRQFFDTEIYSPGNNHVWGYVGEGSHAICVDKENDGNCDFSKWNTWESWDKKGPQVLYNNYKLIEIDSDFINQFKGAITLEKSSVLGINIFDFIKIDKYKDRKIYIPIGGSPPKYAWEQKYYYNPEKLRPYSMQYAVDYVSDKFNQTKTQVAGLWNNLVSGISGIFNKPSEQQAGISASLPTLIERPAEVELPQMKSITATLPEQIQKRPTVLERKPISLGSLEQLKSELTAIKTEIKSKLDVEIVRPAEKKNKKEDEKEESEDEEEPVVITVPRTYSGGGGGSSSSDNSEQEDESEPESATTSTPEIIDTTSPSMVIDLSASSGSSRGTIDLSWTAPGDDESVGSSTEYIIKYATSSIDSSNWASSTDVSGEPTPSSASSTESLTINELDIGQTYYFALKSEDELDNTSEISNIADASPNALSDNVVINEIQLGTREFVELYNPTSQAIDMTGWYWSYFSSARDWNNPYRNQEFPSGASISSGGYYLIGLNGYSPSGYLPPDWRPYETSQIGNSKGSIAIFPWDPTTKTPEEAENSAIDVLGWGNVSYVYEVSAPAASSLEKSLVRNITGWDTNNNQDDFIEKDWPNPKNSQGESLTIIVSSTQVSQSSTWDLSGSPYILESDSNSSPTIESGATLTIEPSVIIEGISQDYPSLVIEGILKAEGTSNSPITFTGNATSSNPGDWLGIEFDNSNSGSVLDYVDFEYGGNYQALQSTAKITEMVRINNSSVTIKNSTFENSMKNGLYLYNSGSSISNSSFSSEEKDIIISGSGSQPTIENCQFGGSTGIKIFNQSSPIISNNTFSNNYPIMLNSAYPSLSNNQSDSNNLNGVYIEPESIFSQSATWKSDLPYVLYSGSGSYPTVAIGTTLTIEPGAVIKPISDYYQGLLIKGKLVAQGTTSTPIVFTSLKDDSYGGDANADNNNTTPSAGDWKNIKFDAGSIGELNHILFRYGSAQVLNINSQNVNLGSDINYEP